MEHLTSPRETCVDLDCPTPGGLNQTTPDHWNAIRKTLVDQRTVGLDGSVSPSGRRQVGGSHYQGFEIEPIDFIVKNKLDYREGNVVKYTCRHKRKNGAEDIRKAIQYLEMILEDYENE